LDTTDVNLRTNLRNSLILLVSVILPVKACLINCLAVFADALSSLSFLICLSNATLKLLLDLTNFLLFLVDPLDDNDDEAVDDDTLDTGPEIDSLFSIRVKLYGYSI
jgi:hypothetical protein